MFVENPFSMVQELPEGQRLLGLDVGEKTIGLALSDVRRVIATPLETIRRTKFSKDIETLKGIIAAQKVGGLVVGLPVNMDGTEGPRCQSIRDFSRNLIQHTSLPVLLWDERMSTMAVTRTLLEADLSRKRRSEVVDKVAAGYILQGVLDYIRSY